MPRGVLNSGLSKREMPVEFYVPGIYAIVNIALSTAYIGFARNICWRWYGHRSLLRMGKHSTWPLQRAWDYYGEAAFRLEVLEVIPLEASRTFFRLRERHHLAHTPYCLYNLSDEAVIRIK